MKKNLKENVKFEEFQQNKLSDVLYMSIKQNNNNGNNINKGKYNPFYSIPKCVKKCIDVIIKNRELTPAMIFTYEYLFYKSEQSDSPYNYIIPLEIKDHFNFKGNYIYDILKKLEKVNMIFIFKHKYYSVNVYKINPFPSLWNISEKTNIEISEICKEFINKKEKENEEKKEKEELVENKYKGIFIKDEDNDDDDDYDIMKELEKI